MRNLAQWFIVITCIFFTIIYKFILDESFNDFLTIKISNIKKMKIKQEENSLAEALKKRFKQLTLNNSIENIPICPIGITNHSNNLIFKEKFTKLSKNFLITQSTPSKYYKIFNFENNYLAHNQTNKSKTGIFNVFLQLTLKFKYFLRNFLLSCLQRQH